MSVLESSDEGLHYLAREEVQAWRDKQLLEILDSAEEALTEAQIADMIAIEQVCNE